jgi:hypothetical protein
MALGECGEDSSLLARYLRHWSGVHVDSSGICKAVDIRHMSFRVPGAVGLQITYT